MSRIEDRIAKYCPNGVEYKAVAEVAGIKNGSDYKHLSEGSIPVYGSGGMMDVRVSFASYDKPTVLLPRKGSITNVFYVDKPFWNIDTIFYTEIDTSKITPRYFYHVMLNAHIERYSTGSAARPSLTQTALKKIKIPVPPLEVQDEIVRILDSFTKLEAELEAELEARRQQYEYYRDSLLNFDDSKQSLLDSEFQENQFRDYVTVDEICNVTRGKVISKQYLREHPGVYPVYSSQTINSGIFGNIDSFMFDGEYLTWTTDGANAGSVFYRNGKFNTTNVCGLLELADERFDIRFLFHYLSIALPKYVSTGMGNRKLMSNVVKSVRIPFVQKAEQERIVAILDKFDALVNDLSSGLPAEIAARRKQYEYYRDRLLTFTPAK